MKETCIIISGNPVDGLNFFGPFDDIELAIEWAAERFDEWWSATLYAPSGLVQYEGVK